MNEHPLPAGYVTVSVEIPAMKLLFLRGVWTIQPESAFRYLLSRFGNLFTRCRVCKTL